MNELGLKSSISLVESRVTKEAQSLKDADAKCLRSAEHVRTLEDFVNNTPIQIDKMQDEMNRRIGDGLPVKKIDADITKLRSESDRNEAWLNDQSDKFIALATDEQRVARNVLAQATDKALGEPLAQLTEDACKGLSLMFSAYESWEQILQGIAAQGLPRPLNNQLLSVSGFIETVYEDRDKIRRFNLMLKNFPGDVMKAKYAISDSQIAASKEVNPDVKHSNDKIGTPYKDRPTDTEMVEMIDDVVKGPIRDLITEKMQSMGCVRKTASA